MQVQSEIVSVCLDALMKTKRIRCRLVVQVLPTYENRGWNKRVESVWFPCADVGSTPTRSTS